MSKGLPRKNTLKLGGIPLLGWTFDSIARSGLTDATCVLSTDDPEIANIGREIGLDVPFMRPGELATDEASAVDVALHADEWLTSNRGTKIDAIMWLQPTSPFRPPATLTTSMRMLSDESRIDAVLGVKPITARSAPFTTLTSTSNLCHWPRTRMTRRGARQ